MMFTTTLNKMFDDKRACVHVKTLLSALGKRGLDDEPISMQLVSSILERKEAMFIKHKLVDNPKAKEALEAMAKEVLEVLRKAGVSEMPEPALDDPETYVNDVFFYVGMSLMSIENRTGELPEETVIAPISEMFHKLYTTDPEDVALYEAELARIEEVSAARKTLERKECIKPSKGAILKDRYGIISVVVTEGKHMVVGVLPDCGAYMVYRTDGTDANMVRASVVGYMCAKEALKRFDREKKLEALVAHFKEKGLL